MAAEVNVVLARELWPRSLVGQLGPADEPALRDSALAEQRDRREQIAVTFGPPDVPAQGPSARPARHSRTPPSIGWQREPQCAAQAGLVACRTSLVDLSSSCLGQLRE